MSCRLPVRGQAGPRRRARGAGGDLRAGLLAVLARCGARARPSGRISS